MLCLLITDPCTSQISDSTGTFSYDAINTIIAVAIFVLGFVITNLINKNNKRKELELYKLLIVDWTKSEFQSITTYIENLILFANNIRENDSLNIAQYTSNVITFKRLNSLTIEKITDALVVNIKDDNKPASVKHLHNYLFQLDYFEEATTDIWKKYEQYCKMCDELREEWNKAYIPLNSLLIERYSVPKEELSELEISFLDAIERMFYGILSEKKDELDEIGISIWNEKFIKPAFNLIGSNEGYSKSIKLRPFIKLIKDLLIVRVKHDSYKRFAEVFLRSSDVMKKAQGILYDSVEYFEQHDIKSFWFIK